MWFSFRVYVRVFSWHVGKRRWFVCALGLKELFFLRSTVFPKDFEIHWSPQRLFCLLPIPRRSIQDHSSSAQGRQDLPSAAGAHVEFASRLAPHTDGGGSEGGQTHLRGRSGWSVFLVGSPSIPFKDRLTCLCRGRNSPDRLRGTGWNLKAEKPIDWDMDSKIISFNWNSHDPNLNTSSPFEFEGDWV